MKTTPERKETSKGACKEMSKLQPVYQSIRVDEGPKLILVDRGRILDEIKLNEFDTRIVKTHQGQILSCVMEATTYYRTK